MGFLSNLLPVIAGGALASTGVGAPAAAAMLGGLQYARTGSLQKGLMAGLGAYGGAGLTSGIMGAGAGEIGREAATEATKNAINPSDASAWGSEGTTGRAGLTSAEMQQQVADKMANASSTDKFGAGLTSGNIGSTLGGMGHSMAGLGLAAAAPALMAPQNTVPTTTSGDSTMPQRLQYNVGRPTDDKGQTVTPAPDVPSYQSGMTQNFGRQQNYFPNAGYQNITAEQAKAMRGYAGGGPIEAMSNANAIGANTGYPQADINKAAYATPWQTPISENVVQGTADTGVNSMTGEQNEFAKGGLSAAASHLGDYSDGGRLLKGPGDGVSDSIPAVIGKKQPARLADNEFVIPARIVSEIGNGSTDAGARKLYAMLDRVQAARKKSIGKGKVAVDSKAYKALDKL